MAGNIRLMNNNSSTGNRYSGNSNMMTGSVNATGHTVKKPRRLWTLHDRSAISVNLLKANLAQDGCEEAQVNVAKNLLNDVSDESTGVLNENARLAIYWLIKSSEQGNEEATELLKSCLDSSRGINCQNTIDVQMCIDTPRNEKLTIKAAKLLYDKLNNGEDFITTTQLESRLLQIKESKTVSFLAQNSRESTPPSLEPGNVFTPRTPPSAQSQLGDSDAQASQRDVSSSWDRKGQAHSDCLLRNRNSNSGSIPDAESTCKNQCHDHTNRRGIKLTLDDMIKNATAYNVGDTPPILLINQVMTLNQECHIWKFKSYMTFSFLQLILLTLIWGNVMLNTQNIFLVGGMVLGVWSSYNIMGWYWTQSNFADWTLLFKNVLREENWSAAVPTTRLYKNHCRPYLLASLLCATIFFVCSTCHQDNSTSSWIQISVGCLTVLTLLLTFQLSNQPPSFPLVVIATIQVLPMIATCMTSPGMFFDAEYFDDIQNNLIDIGKEYSLEFSILFDVCNEYLHFSILKIIEAALCIKLVSNGIGFGSDDHGKSLSEIILVLWLYNIIQTSQSVSIVGNEVFFGSGLALLGIIMCVYVFSIFNNVKLWKLCTGISVCLAITFPLLVSLDAAFDIDITRSFTGNLISHESVNVQDLTWDEYDVNCHQSAWKQNNLGYTQLSCPLKYLDKQIRWNGLVSIVKLRQQHRQNSKDLTFEIFVNMKNTKVNSHETWQNFLPFHINHILQQPSDSLDPTILVLIKATTVGDIHMKLIQHVLSLRSKDEIEFVGRLGNNIGGVVPEITDVEILKCIRCQIANYGEFNLITNEPSSIKEYFNRIYGQLVDKIQIVLSYAHRLFYKMYLQFDTNNSISPISDD